MLGKLAESIILKRRAWVCKDGYNLTKAWVKYCTISAYFSPLVTRDRHEEMSISLVPEMRCDGMDISSPAEM